MGWGNMRDENPDEPKEQQNQELPSWHGKTIAEVYGINTEPGLIEKRKDEADILLKDREEPTYKWIVDMLLSCPDLGIPFLMSCKINGFTPQIKLIIYSLFELGYNAGWDAKERQDSLAELDRLMSKMEEQDNEDKNTDA